MKTFKDKVAVVTGAASGIGRGLAERCVQEGMRVVLVDIEAPALERAAEELKAAGGQVLAVRTDVSKLDEVQRLAGQVLKTFGGVHLLCNNAGVGAGRPVWETTQRDWEWVLGVNLWGVIHGVRTFVPIMLAQNEEGHVVNTASIEGLWSRPRNAIYQVSKHAVVCLSEVLHHDLIEAQAQVRVSVLCPGAVDTGIVDSWRNRPPDLANAPEDIPILTPEMEERMRLFRQALAEGMKPAEVADLVFKAIREERFYVFTHPELKEHVRHRMENILEERWPTFIPLEPQPSGPDAA